MSGLGRVERLGQAGFARPEDLALARCPDCEERGALTNEGRVKRVNGMKLSAGCETCKGWGSVPSDSRRDPYEVTTGFKARVQLVHA